MSNGRGVCVCAYFMCVCVYFMNVCVFYSVCVCVVISCMCVCFMCVSVSFMCVSFSVRVWVLFLIHSVLQKQVHCNHKSFAFNLVV